MLLNLPGEGAHLLSLASRSTSGTTLTRHTTRSLVSGGTSSTNRTILSLEAGKRKCVSNIL